MFKNLGVLNKESKAENLYNTSFATAGILIAKMDVYEKAEIAREIDTITLALYEEASKVDQFEKVPGCRYPIPMLSMENYMFIMSTIKRYEIILNYLFEINDMLERDEIARLIAEAEEQIAQFGATQDKKHDMSTLKADLAATKGETAEIHNKTYYYTSLPELELKDKAADLVAKYFNK